MFFSFPELLDAGVARVSRRSLSCPPTPLTKALSLSPPPRTHLREVAACPCLLLCPPPPGSLPKRPPRSAGRRPLRCVCTCPPRHLLAPRLFEGARRGRCCLSACAWRGVCQARPFPPLLAGAKCPPSILPAPPFYLERRLRHWKRKPRLAWG